jgi:CYTH domain-containing protein
MPKEFERKFLVSLTPEDLAAGSKLAHRRHGITQGYLELGTGSPWAARVRRTVQLDAGLRVDLRADPPFNELILKRGRTEVESDELITELTPEEYLSWTAECAQPVILKTRHYISLPEDGDRLWSVDQFHNPPLRGLLLAEVELPGPDEFFVLPSWATVEVTKYAQYRNEWLRRYAAAYPERTQWVAPPLFGHAGLPAVLSESQYEPPEEI